MNDSDNRSRETGQAPAPKNRGKSKLLISIAIIGVLAISLAGFFLFRGSGTSRDHEKSQDKVTMYQCPMHPEIIRDKPGSCPICGMDLVPMEDSDGHDAQAASGAEPAGDNQGTAGQATTYICPMHPNIVKDGPGSCPICGMDLVPEESGTSSSDESTVPGYSTVTVDAAKRGRMGLRLDIVEERALVRDIRTSAKILVDETRQVRVTTKIEGWVGELYVATTGQPVEKGDALLTIYSPELVSAQEEYLSALTTQAQLASSSDEAREGGSRLVEAARRRLELWDISDEQIKRLEDSRQVEKYLTLYAPSSGWMIERMVLPGQKVMPAEPLLVIAELSKVWADADIYQSDLPHVQVGMPVEITLPAWPGKTIDGRVTFVTPTLDPETRTMRARLEVSNKDMLLKPGMYATARLEHVIGRKLAVPISGVMFTGIRTLVFRQGTQQQLVPVEVQLGARSGDYYEVISGLNEGDSVVTSANFLIDSESSMAAARKALTKGQTAAQPEHTGH